MLKTRTMSKINTQPLLLITLCPYNAFINIRSILSLGTGLVFVVILSTPHKQVSHKHHTWFVYEMSFSHINNVHFYQ